MFKQVEDGMAVGRDVPQGREFGGDVLKTGATAMLVLMRSVKTPLRQLRSCTATFSELLQIWGSRGHSAGRPGRKALKSGRRGKLVDEVRQAWKVAVPQGVQRGVFW